MGPANQTLPINTIAVLPCQASGNPKPSIRWFRDQKPITEMDSSSRLMVEETGTLVIDSKFIIDKGPSINYVVSKSHIFDPSPLLVVVLLSKIGNF